MRYAVIEKSTDLRYPQTKITFTTSLAKAKRIRELRSGRFTYDDPDEARNWHRTFVYVYQLPTGWRKPSEKFLREEARKESTPTYPRTPSDILGEIIRKVGTKVDLVWNDGL